MTDLSALGSRTSGVWTRRRALKLVTPARIAAHVRDGGWQVVYPGVYADGGYVLSDEQLGFAAVLATGEEDEAEGTHVAAVACGRTAARIWGLPLIDDADPATGAFEHLVDDVHTWRQSAQRELVTPEGRRLVRHHLTFLDREVVQHRSGLWLTSPVRTALDCVGLLSEEAAVCLVDAALFSKAFSLSELERAVRARAGWPGVGRQRRAAQLADGRAESPSETLARLLLLPVLPELVPQVRVRDRNGRVVARVDLGIEELRLAVEADGRRGHAGDVMVAKDKRRDRRTGRLGWATERVTWFDLRKRQAEVTQRVLEGAQEQRRRWG